ncbi:MAG TPA: ATP-binding protein, partial [Ferruginibacter sp.]|nr:ATP-binding protein [Ferruginibacter sp.]
ITVLGLLLLTFGIGPVSGGFAFYSLIWLLGFLFLLNNNYLNLIASRIITSRLVFWLFFFSVSITAIIIKENDLKELRNRLHYAEILSTKADPASETLVNTMLTDFRVDFLSGNFNRLRDLRENQFFKDSLINNNFTGYTNRYDTRVFSFDANEQPLFNSENITYNQLNTILNTQARPTGIEGLYYYDQSYDLFNYISKKTIYDFAGNLQGTLFIIVSPKNIKSETLYPELFSKGHNYAIENSSLYAFAIYNKNKLISSHNDYPFATVLPGRYFAGQPFLLLQSGNYDELWYNAGADKYVVIVKEHRVSIESITLFSYLFCSFLLLTAGVWLLNILIRSRLDPGKLREYWQLTIRNQIHGIIIFISAVSFIVIGIATILFFIGRYENNNREQLSRAINIMVYQTSKALSEGWRLERDTLNENPRNIEQIVNTISEIHGVDINLYDLDGNLKVSSLPLPYAKGIVSTKMDPVAYYHLHHQKEVQYFQKENIGRLNFVSSYVPVMDASGNPYVYLNIPYFTSESKLKEEISNFLVTIINLNAFIFLIAGIVALFITNRITNSFSLISDKMKNINLGKQNEAIEWHRKDEIGELVIEYNKMLKKLDESAAALAKTEREGAWREMARQVAHEIKNPLTPMKLSMQFLQRSIENNASNVKELAASVSNTLIEQIDHLSKIAGEFSQFANIGNANKEKMDLNEALKSVKRLYSGNEKTMFRWNLLKTPVIIYADKTHINRLFTNLIQNALQAVPETKDPVIVIEEDLSEGSILIRVTDNGEGINENIQANIFTPNFTTKTSGTGLGLAMCKRIVEQSNGQIWFETGGEGTTFYIIFPLAS